jgi:hypothetical protein
MHDDDLWRQPLLERLGVADGAAAADIRRAYARALKKIDQEADPAGFQSLREAYETLMQWTAHRAQSSSSTIDDAAPPVSLTKPATPQLQQAAHANAAEALAVVAYTHFAHAASALVDSGKADDQPAWEKALADTRNTEAQRNVSARTLFEGRIADRLVQGWQPGHHILFAAAQEVFQWRKDRQRILFFGYPGALLDQAIEEMAMIDRQGPGEADFQRRVLIRLRQNNRPNGKNLGTAMFHLDQMLHRFPALSSVTLDPDVVALWRDAHAALPEEEQGTPFAPTDIPWNAESVHGAHAQSKSESIASYVLQGMGVLYLLYQVARLF